MVRRSLTETAKLWPDIRRGFAWVHHVASILKNEAGRRRLQVQRRFSGLLGALSAHRKLAGAQQTAIEHFLKVTRSYWPGLFACYEVPDLPRTNNGLEQFFGAHRYHERRATGRKVASPALVLRGSVRLLAAAATRLRTYAARDLIPFNLSAWRQLHQQLEQRRQNRTLRRRFRRDPSVFLAHLEQQLIQLTLPA